MQFITRNAALALAAVVAIAGCKGKDGADGTNGTPGTTCNVSTVGGTTTISCADGTTGTVTTGTVINGSSCSLVWNADGSRTASCPDGNTLVLPAVVIPGRLTVANESVANATNTADLAFNLDIKVDGVPRDEFTRLTTVRTWVFNATAGAGTRTSYGTRDTDNPTIFATFTVKSNGNGNYTVTMPGFGSTGARPAAAGTVFLVNLNAGVPQPAATAVAVLNNGTWPAAVLVDNQACMNCHGENVFNKVDPATGIILGHEDNYNPKGVDACVVCHDRDSTMETRLGVNGTRLMGYVHGIHNSHNMPGAFDTSGVAVPGKTYYRNGTATATFSIGFPGYMNNCSTCHTATAMTSAVPSIQVSWATCMSCHVGPPTLAGTQTVAAGFAWAGFGVANTGTNTAPIFLLGGAQNHANFTSATTCAATACHGDAATGSAKLTLADFHNGQKTERNGLIWNGSDQSVIEGAKFALAITGVTRAAGNYQVTWTATYNGVAVDPCNADFAVGPVFLPELVAADAATGKSASNMSFVKAYGQGDDWVNANRTSASGVAPGQPATSPTLTVVGLPATATAGAVAPNTTCAANVATSTFTNDTATFGPAGTRAAMALQGKPQIRFAAAAGTPGEFIQVRAKSPVFNYTVPAADGAATAAAARRPVVDTAKCLACHKGTLYQHGGNRVDNVDLCDTCHNPASSDQNNRVTFFGVDATEAYDGKAAETYDMRTMIHSIHAAGENGRAWILYRTRGIYFFGNAASFADVVANKNWPTTGVTCKNAEGLMVTYSEVFGSVPGATEMVPVVKPDGTCDLTGGATPTPATHAWQVHNVVLVEYPRPLNQCSACHTGGSDQVFPDPTKAVAVTTNIGAVGVGATNGNQLDDTLIGPSVQSCMTCHQSGDAVGQAQLRAHGYQYGWTPAVFTNGRADLLNLVQVETCTVCHGAGKIADFKAAHNK